MALLKKSAAFAALALALVLPAAPAAADDYTGGNPPCIPGESGSGSGTDSDGDGTPDECDKCDEMPERVESGEDDNGNGIDDACEGETGGTVEPGDAEKPGEATTGGAGTAQPGPAAAEAPSGSLPVTGGDVVGLTLIGLFAVGTGAVLVRRSRRDGSAATTA